MNPGGSIAVACSAPGKVLLAGGYLVLDRDYTGLVYGLDARIYVRVKNQAPAEQLPRYIVSSPQFTDATWSYDNDFNQLNGQETNRFVQTALAFAITYASSADYVDDSPILITILADTDYYSHATTASSEGRFVNFDVPINEAHKTGLGSSAALVTALTAAVLSYHLPSDEFDIASRDGQVRLHNLAQAAHCAAQGKVGSGFDVAAAVYGSCIYRRFSPRILEKLGDVNHDGFSERLKAIVDNTDPENKWDTQVDKSGACIPRGLALVMCDVDCGSKTVGMARSVLQWTKEKPGEATLLWATLQTANEDLGKQLRLLTAAQLLAAKDLQEIQSTILTIRSLVREMSTKTGVPIEPPVQTSLLNACSKLPGVLGGVVPGAGGYDAIVLLVEDRKEILDELREYLHTYQAEIGVKQDSGIGKVQLLGVKQEGNGVKAEDPSLFDPW